MAAEVQTYAVVDDATNIVVNVVLWDGEAEWAPPDGCTAVQSDTLYIGATYTPKAKPKTAT